MHGERLLQFFGNGCSVDGACTRGAMLMHRPVHSMEEACPRECPSGAPNCFISSRSISILDRGVGLGEESEPIDRYQSHIHSSSFPHRLHTSCITPRFAFLHS